MSLSPYDFRSPNLLATFWRLLCFRTDNSEIASVGLKSRVCEHDTSSPYVGLSFLPLCSPHFECKP